jgi:cytochrome c biogenesis factor
VITIGEVSLWIALLLSAWAAVVSFFGERRERLDLLESGKRAVCVTALLVLVSSAALWNALFSHDLSLAAVASHTTRNLPGVYLFSAFWEGRAGALLFATLCLACVGTIAVLSFRKWSPVGGLTGVLGVFLLLLLAACLAANPFARLEWVPVEGVGLNSRVQNPRALLHTPVLYLAYATSAIAIAAAAVAVSESGIRQQMPVAVRRWLAVAWALSSAAVLTGLAWAYREPGMLGSWMLQPIRDGSVFLWIALGVALLANLRRANASSSAYGDSQWRRIAASVAVIGAMITSVGVGGVLFRKATAIQLAGADSAKITGHFGEQWTITSEGFSRYTALNRNVTAVALQVERNGKRAGLVTTEIRQYFDGRGAPLPRVSVEPGVRSTWNQDLYVFLTSYDETGRAGLQVLSIPFAKWIWVGGSLLTLCGLWLFWRPAKERLT